MAGKGKLKTISGKKAVLGINGLGRIGKLSLWNHIARKYFTEIVINIGRRAGSRLDDIALYIEKDSSYGALHNYLYGYMAQRVIDNLDEHSGTMTIDGIPVTVLRESRNPRNIPWGEYGAKVVVEATGKFTNPTVPFDAAEGSVRGHLESGAEKVIVSAPFKTKDRNIPMPSDIVTVVMGINEEEYHHTKHQIISGASCTTTCLAHMVKPLMDHFGAEKIISASMDTIHSCTGSQEVLDRLPKAGAADLRKSRSVMNNIILTTTGAAKTLGLVIPEMNRIGFMAESVRIPVPTGSLIILVITLRDEPDRPPVSREVINNIYRDAAKREKRGYVRYTDEQNVSSDIIGFYGPAAIIEGHETHTRTAYVRLDIAKLCKLSAENVSSLPDPEIPITNIVIYGWYDNELGSYTNMLGDLTVKVASTVYQ
jgi:glyceraldehyde 3-phosphate dehydrogenase